MANFLPVGPFLINPDHLPFVEVRPYGNKNKKIVTFKLVDCYELHFGKTTPGLEDAFKLLGCTNFDPVTGNFGKGQSQWRIMNSDGPYEKIIRF